MEFRYLFLKKKKNSAPPSQLVKEIILHSFGQEKDSTWSPKDSGSHQGWAVPLSVDQPYVGQTESHLFPTPAGFASHLPPHSGNSLRPLNPVA